MAHSETLEFQAESKQLLDLMIHSIYSNKEIFLRELISNASDALDRYRLEALTSKKAAKKESELHIRIETDPSKRTLTIHDNGVGMSRDEVISNIGTIARSGTKQILQKLKEEGKSVSAEELIGQFGVGFYSTFMVADKVTMITKRVGEDQAVFWESDGDGKYRIDDAERDSHGTTITLHLKPVDEENGIEDYTQFWVVKNIVKRHSDFIGYPIKMEHEVSEKGEKEDETVTKIEDETMNSMKPIWARDKKDVTDEEYSEFYKHVSHDWTDPLETVAFKAEGVIQYNALLFIPQNAPFDLYYQGFKSGLELYVKRVKIMDNFEDLLPHYLRFVKGVVDSPDLPLNISREMLQRDRHIEVIKKNLVKKILRTLSDIMENDMDKYLKFWGQFGTAVKEGLTSDFENKDKIVDLLLFQSTEDPEKLTTLKEYVERMKDGQNEIYYFTGDSRQVMENSPHLEIFKKKGYEVLMLTEAVDELVVQSVYEYQEKKLKSIEKGKLDLGDEEEKKEAQEKLEEQEKEYHGILDLFKTTLEEHVKEVRLTDRLVETPACMVTDENDMSPHLEKLLRHTNMSMGGMKQKRILELNPEHPIVKKVQDLFGTDQNDPILGDYAELLMDYALLAEGAELPNPVRFNQLLLKLMERNV